MHPLNMTSCLFLGGGGSGGVHTAYTQDAVCSLPTAGSTDRKGIYQKLEDGGLHVMLELGLTRNNV